MKNVFRKKFWGTISITAFFLIWQLIAQLEIIRPIFIGMPTKIAKEFFLFFYQGDIYPYLLNSAQALFWGFSISILVGALGGLLIGSSKKLYQLINPYIFSIHVTPKIAIIPLAIIWFGIGINAKVFIIFLSSVVPILINTIDCVRGMDKNLLKMAKSFEASKTFVIKHITFFYALPAIISGIRIALGRAFMGLLVAEFFGMGNGLGYLISFYGATLQTNKLMASIFIIIFINLILLRAIDILKKNIVKWQ